MSNYRTRVRKAAGERAVPYIAPPPIQQWLCGDTVGELHGWAPRVIAVRDRPEVDAGLAAPSGWELSWIDGLAGGGGSSQGIHRVVGNGVRMAINHWPLAVETHNHNMPWVDHDVANVARVDPGRYPRTDCAWFSPECTTWSVAQGRKCDFDTDWEQPSLLGDDEDEDTPADKEARWRSRMLMTDVIRFARYHRYKAVIVENVPDILKWSAFPRWIAEMAKEGYDHKVITLNSAFAHGWGPAAPQLRDRVYVVFWLRCYRTPNWNKWLRPTCWCPTCQQVVAGIYAPKPGPRRPMRYGAQYVYRCPNTRCRGGEALPYVRPASSVIDFTLPAQRIGDRKRPLAPKTRQRVEDGLWRMQREGWGFDGAQVAPMLVPTGGTRRRDAAPVTRPMATRTTTENDAVVVPPGAFLTVLRSDRSRTIAPGAPLATVVADGSNHALVVPLEGRDGQRARGADEPLRAQTTRHQDALVVPLRNNGVARPAGSAPLVTVAAGGEHQALVMRNNDTQAGDQGYLSTPAGEPLRTLTTAGHQSLVEHGHALYQYDTGNLQPVAAPMPTQTTVEGDALMRLAVDVDDCTLRMLDVLKEIKPGMDFPAGYELLGKSKRNWARMLGNAVTGCSAADLVACVTEAVTGVDLPRYELSPAA